MAINSGRDYGSLASMATKSDHDYHGSASSMATKSDRNCGSAIRVAKSTHNNDNWPIFNLTAKYKDMNDCVSTLTLNSMHNNDDNISNLDKKFEHNYDSVFLSSLDSFADILSQLKAKLENIESKVDEALHGISTLKSEIRRIESLSGRDLHIKLNHDYECVTRL